MNVELHERGRVRLVDAGGSTCVSTNEQIDNGRHRVRLDLVADGEVRSHVDIGVGAVDEIVESWPDRDLDPLDGAESLEYLREGDKNVFECVICGDTEYEGACIGTRMMLEDGEISIFGTSFPFLHENCVGEFCDVLDKVWDYSDELLAERV